MTSPMLDRALKMLEGIRKTEAASVVEFMKQGRTIDTIRALVDNAHFWSEQLVSEVFAPITQADRDRVHCRPGCSWCCHQLVTTTSVEAIRLVVDLRKRLPAKELRVVEKRIVERDNRTRGLAMRERALLRLSCPLVDDDGRCAVHAHRPLACRGEHSFEAEECRRAFEAADHTTRVVERNPWLKDIPTSVLWGIEDGLEQCGMQGDRLELNAALAIALSDSTVQALLSGERPFTPARAAEEVASIVF